MKRALSIRSKSTVDVRYKRKGDAKDEAMCRVAIQLRQKQEFARAEKVMNEAIKLKKKLLKGDWKNEDLAYLYNELAVTYHASGQF